MGMAQEIIKKFTTALADTPAYGRGMLNKAVRASTSFDSWQDVIDAMITDVRAYDGDSDGFLRDKCGIILDNEDTGAISGKDAGGDTVKTAESIVPETGEHSLPPKSTVEINGLTVHYPDIFIMPKRHRNIISMLNTWWIPNSLELIKESYGIDFINSNPSVKELTVQFVSNQENTLAHVDYETSYEDEIYKVSSLTLSINTDYYDEISTTDPNGVSPNTEIYMDRAIAHEMTHAVMAATTDNFAFLPGSYFLEGMAELIHGIDDIRGSDIEYLAKTPSYLEPVLTDKIDAGSSSYAAGYMLLRYFAKQSGINLAKGASVEGDAITLDDSFYTSLWLDGTNIFSGEEVYKNDSIIDINAKNTVNNGVLAGNNQSNKIEAGSGDCDIWGGWLGDDTMIGGAGSDTFWYGKNEGNDTIENISSSDTVKLFDIGLSDISGIDFNNNNILLNFYGGGSLNILDGKTAGNVFILGSDNSSWKYDNSNGNWNLV